MGGAGDTRRGGHPAALRVARRAQTTGDRRSIRLRAYDYSTPAGYFVTFCTANRRPTLATKRAQLIVENAWRWLPNRFPSIDLDEIIVMPDHVHCIVWIIAPDDQAEVMPSLGTVIGALKTVAAQSINKARGSRGRAVWQRGYYEHIVRDERELETIRQYISANPSMSHSHETDDMKEAWAIIAPNVRDGSAV